MASNDYTICEKLATLMGYTRHREEGFGIGKIDVWRDERGYKFEGLITDLMYDWHKTFDRLVHNHDMSVVVSKNKEEQRFMAVVEHVVKIDEHAGRALCLAATIALEERVRHAREAVRD